MRIESGPQERVSENRTLGRDCDGRRSARLSLSPERQPPERQLDGSDTRPLVSKRFLKGVGTRLFGPLAFRVPHPDHAGPENPALKANWRIVEPENRGNQAYGLRLRILLSCKHFRSTLERRVQVQK